ncbi:ATP-binding protein [Candidatus Woesearchaeota archaeon]|nr:ATP-binding protein [Candidatus Woesearchaeota archaeon]
MQTYIGYFVETYLFFIVEQEGKLNERIKANKKFYCADVGVKNVLHGYKDLGSVYENLVFLKIKHKKPRYYKKGDVEIDFTFDDWLIEAKFGQELEGKQKTVFESVKKKKKLVAQGVSFFTNRKEI